MVDCNPRDADARCNPALRHPGRAKSTTISARCRSRTATVVALIRRSNSRPSSASNTILVRATGSPPDTVIGAALAKPTFRQVISETLH
jgi:hypothetical protein